MLLRQHNLCDGAPVNGERLEELRARPHRLRVLHDHSHRAAAGPISDLYPVPAHASERTEHGSRIRRDQLVKAELTEAAPTGFRCEVDGQRGDGVIGWVVIKLRHQEVIIFHSEGKFLHVCKKKEESKTKASKRSRGHASTEMMLTDVVDGAVVAAQK